MGLVIISQPPSSSVHFTLSPLLLPQSHSSSLRRRFSARRWLNPQFTPRRYPPNLPTNFAFALFGFPGKKEKKTKSFVF
ncbi:hypothetical protein CsSME_00010596 [Camellia sinensis var. sinensis]